MGLIGIFYRVNKNLVSKLSLVQNLSEKENLLNQSIEILDLQKSWDAMGYILTNQKVPNNHILSNLFYPKDTTVFIEKEKVEKFMSGNLTALDKELIYELEHHHLLSIDYVQSAELEKIHNVIEGIDLKKLIEEFDFDKLNEAKIYPGHWSKDHAYKLLEKLELLFLMIKNAYKMDHILLFEIG